MVAGLKQSLRTRLALGILVSTLAALWAVTLLISHTLRQDMERSISAQQFSTVSLIAQDINHAVNDRTGALYEAARIISSQALLPGRAQSFLNTQNALKALFNWGVVITDSQGKAIASIPHELDRVGTDYGDLPFFKALETSSHPVVSEPMQGKRTKVWVVSIGIPLFNQHGAFIGTLFGVTNLELPNFLNEISATRYGLTGEFLLTAPNSRLFIASTNQQRTFKKGPPKGINPLFDRYLEGFEGSGIAVSSRGTEELSSSKIIPSTGWMTQSVLPTEEAFAPVRALQHRLFALSLIVSLLLTGFAWWWIRRQIKPLEQVARAMEEIGLGTRPRAALPIERHDEIGQMVVAFNGLLTAIAEQEQMLAKTAALQRVRKILEHVPGMVFEYYQNEDGSGAFPFASEAARSIYEVPPEALENDSLIIRKKMLPEDAERLFGSLHRSAESMDHWRTEYRIRANNGQIKTLHVEATPEQDEHGKVVWYGFVTDVTETQAMQSELEQHRHHLEDLVGERTLQLKAAKQVAEEANLAKTTFLANMSHEIRTPLNAITGMAHLIRRSGVTPQQAERLDKIDAAGKHLLEVINAILDLSKIESGKLQLTLQPIQIQSVLSNVASMVGERAQNKGLKLLLEKGPPIASVMGDATRLQQALLNYVANAIKFTEQGTVILRCKLESETSTQCALRFEVEDSGIGIPAESLHKLFSAFEQADNSISRHYGGTGLGLAITRRLAEMMGGAAGVDSQPNQGSCFWFTVCLEKAETAPTHHQTGTWAEDEKIIHQHHAGKRVLIVDDDEINREIACDILLESGLTIETAINGAQALEKVQTGSYALILMDMQMPVMDGLEATRQIRARHPDWPVPILAMTANAFAEDRARCTEAGMDDFIPKPVEPDVLFSKLRYWLNNERHRQPKH